VDRADRIVVSGPAVPETLRVFRSVASSVGAIAGMTLEAMDEFKIAIDEGATLLLRSGNPSTLEIELNRDGGGVWALIRSDTTVGDWPGDRTSSWPWKVIEQLTVSPRFSLAPGGIQIEFTMAARD
jgi:hypothetical protein